MDYSELPTTDITVVNDTIIAKTEWVGLSCELFKIKLLVFFHFLLLLYVVVVLQRRMEKVEKRLFSEGKTVVDKV